MDEENDNKLCLADFVSKTIEEVCEDICDHYCRFPRECDTQEELDSHCQLCPLMRL